MGPEMEKFLIGVFAVAIAFGFVLANAAGCSMEWTEPAIKEFLARPG